MENEKTEKRGGARAGSGRPRGARKNPKLIKHEAERRKNQHAFYLSEIDERKLYKCKKDKLLSDYIRDLILKDYQNKFGE